jgi:hypothetical protein
MKGKLPSWVFSVIGTHTPDALATLASHLKGLGLLFILLPHSFWKSLPFTPFVLVEWSSSSWCCNRAPSHHPSMYLNLYIPYKLRTGFRAFLGSAASLAARLRQIYSASLEKPELRRKAYQSLELTKFKPSPHYLWLMHENQRCSASKVGFDRGAFSSKGQFHIVMNDDAQPAP